jgi:hypothetical protein
VGTDLVDRRQDVSHTNLDAADYGKPMPLARNRTQNPGACPFTILNYPGPPSNQGKDNISGVFNSQHLAMLWKSRGEL